MMQEHMNVEECSALGSTPFMLIVSFLMLLFFVTSTLFSLHFTTNIMQCFLVLNCFVVDANFEYILLYYIQLSLSANQQPYKTNTNCGNFKTQSCFVHGIFLWSSIQYNLKCLKLLCEINKYIPCCSASIQQQITADDKVW